eukprot:c26153_g1_i1 orf=132-1229(+)
MAAMSSLIHGLNRAGICRLFPFGRPLAARSLGTWTSPASQAAVYNEHGPPDQVVRVVDIPACSLKENEVCVKMLAAPINPSDINRIEGVYPIRPPVPAVGGGEGVGIVIAKGDDVGNLFVNDLVIPASSGLGTWRNYIVKEEDAWCKVRNDIPIEYAATVSVNPCTAFRMLEDIVALGARDVVVQNGATSMVGQCVIQLAHLRDLQTVNIVRDRPNLQEVTGKLKKLGATEVLLESQSSKDLLVGLGKPLLGLNCVGGSAASAVMKLLGDGGTMVTYGGMSKKPITVATSAMIFKNLHLRGFWMQNWVNEHTREEFTGMTDYLLGLVKKGVLQYSMEKVPFSQFSLALEKAMGKHGSSSKQVLIF